MTKIVEPYTYIDRILVNDGTSEKVKIYVKNGFSYPLLDSEKDDITVETKYEENIDAPVKKDSEVGNISVYLKNQLIYCEKICTIEDVNKKDIKDKMKDIFDQWYLD